MVPLLVRLIRVRLSAIGEGDAMKGQLLVCGLFAATGAHAAPKPPQYVYFAEAPSDALGKIAGRCMDRNLTVTESDDRHVVCIQTVSGFKGALAQVLIGNSYSTTPTVNIRFQAIAVPGGSRVQFSQWIETQMAFGQVRRVEMDGRKQIQETLNSLYGLGAFGSPPHASGVPTTASKITITPPAQGDAALSANPSDTPGTIDLGGGVKLVPAQTPSGYCIKAPSGYVGSGSVNRPNVTGAKPRCT